MLRAARMIALVGVVAIGCAEPPLGPQATDAPDVAFSHAGGGGSSVDQSQATADAAAGFTLAVGGASNQLLAQTFTSGVTGKLREVEVPVACASGTLVLEIRDLVGGLPGATVLATESFSPSSLTPFTPGVATFNVLRVRPSPNLVSGVPYALVLSNPSGSCGMLPGPVGDPYAAGDGWFFDDVNGQWVDVALGNGREDLPFFTYMK